MTSEGWLRHLKCDLRSAILPIVHAAHDRGLDFLVVGTGRCGTQSAARVLTRFGLHCGHEEVYGSYGYSHPANFLGDASWLAVPYLGYSRCHIVHLVRHPLETMQSLLDIGFFAPATANSFTRFARRHVPITGHPLDDAARWYVTWNEMCEKRADIRFRLDELDLLVAHLAARHGISVDMPAVRSAVGIRHNRKTSEKQKNCTATYEEISDAGLRARLRDMAADYGF